MRWQKLVVMNGVTRHIKGLPEPTRPVDDFSVARPRAPCSSRARARRRPRAQINYWGGRALHNLYEARAQVLPRHTVAQLWFFHDVDRYVQARKETAWTAHVLDIDVHADGSLWRRMWSRKSYWESKRVGNILTWKFSKAALTAPRVVEA